MYGIGAGDLRGGDDRGDAEITLARESRSDADVLIGVANVKRVAIGLRVDSHGLQSHFFAGLNDAQCDLAAIGDEDFGDHQTRMAKSFSPYSIGCPLAG